MRVSESIERRFTKLEESYQYVENWANKTFIVSGVGKKNVGKKKNDNSILHGPDTNSLCNLITLMLKMSSHSVLHTVEYYEAVTNILLNMDTKNIMWRKASWEI